MADKAAGDITNTVEMAYSRHDCAGQKGHCKKMIIITKFYHLIHTYLLHGFSQ